jgi:phospholipase/carboxylesterase
MNESKIEALSIMPNNSNPEYLLVILHGWGANYQDFVPVANVLDLPGFGYLFPNAPFAHPQVPGGRAWYALETQEYIGLTESRELLGNWLMSLEAATGVPLERTIMAGFSQGGAMTLDLGLTLPFAAIASFSGYLHYHPQLQSEKGYPPALIVHGTQDLVVPLKAARQARDELNAIGVSVEYREFDMGHEVPPPAISLFQQFVNASITTNKEEK